MFRPALPRASTLSTNKNQLIINWSGVMDLQCTTDFGATWTSTGISNAPFILVPSNASTFYRLREF